MRTRLIPLLLALAPAVSLAQPADTPPKITFVTFDVHEILGQRTKAQLKRFEGRQRPKFVSLVSLKRDVLGRLRATAADGALR